MLAAHSQLNDQQRFRWAILLAIAVHVLIVLAVGFRLYSPPPPQPVFSLNLALSQQAGGAERDHKIAKPEPFSLPAEAPRIPQPNEQSLAEPQLYFSEPTATSAAEDIEETRPLKSARFTMAASVQPTTQTPVQQNTEQSSRSKTIQNEDKTTLEGYYAEQWRLQVQDLGNRYFPSEAKMQKLSGRLTMDVAVRSDGTLLSIRMLKSSGSSLLDNAARRIVMLGSPYQPFPEPLRRQYDILHIVRTWEFDSQELDQADRLRSER